LGLVPRQHSTGGKTALQGISKRGDSYLRMLLIHGGRAVVRVAHKHLDRKNRWVSELDQRRGRNITAVAVANKNARIAWALLSKRATYQAVAAWRALRTLCSIGALPLSRTALPRPRREQGPEVSSPCLKGWNAGGGYQGLLDASVCVPP